jgi:undecaprenyl-phosphate 4-deoxy-4-formamido-L-arabinose transferase
LINDGSPDNTLKDIINLSSRSKNIKVVNLSKNFGQHAAIMAGLNLVDGDIITCLDDDGQTPANEVFRLIDKVMDGYDVVFAKYEDKQHPLYRNIGSQINNLMALYLINKPKNITITSFFSCRRFIVNEVKKYTNPYPYVSGLLLRSSNNIINVKVNHRSRLVGESNYSFSKLVQLWFNGFTAFSVIPLRIATFSGFMFAIIGFFFAIYTVVNKLINPTAIMGYASLMSALLVIGGILMLILGLIGEYLGRIYISLNHSPQFVIKEKIGFNTPSDEI